MNVFNGEPFLQYNLASIYRHAYQIIIVEGAYKNFSVEPHSTDNTLSIIRNFHDPLKKINLITQDGFWDNREHMCNVF